MKCPVDDTQLVMSERFGIEIDYCPTCRGVWLDRGELDKIIERSARDEEPRPARRESEPREAYRETERYERRDDDRYSGQQKPYRKRKSFLGDIFDFD